MMTLPGKLLRISVVDGEYRIASSLAMILFSLGYEATFFTEPLKALHAARCNAPDLLLSEVSMSLLSGIELAIQVQEHCPDCKVLLFSGVPDIADWLEVGKAKGHNFEVLPKPIHPADLLKEIQSLFGSIPVPTQNFLTACRDEGLLMKMKTTCKISASVIKLISSQEKYERLHRAVNEVPVIRVSTQFA